MHRPTLLVGLAAIVLMCLFPPVKTGAGGALAAMMSGEEVAAVEYRPLWTLSGGGGLESFENGTLAWSRLILQILIVAAVIGGISYYYIGATSSKES